MPHSPQKSKEKAHLTITPLPSPHKTKPPKSLLPQKQSPPNPKPKPKPNPGKKIKEEEEEEEEERREMTTRANVNGGEHYPAPHPPHNHYHYRHRSSSAASFKGCCCCLLLLLTFLALLLVAVVLVIFLAVKPKKPQFDLQQVGVQYLIVTPSYLSLNITMLFTAINPNKVGIKYTPSNFFVMYKGVPLGVATVPSFYQPAHSSRTVETRASVDRVNVLQLDAMDLIRDATVNDRVELRVTGDVGARIRVMDINSPRVKVSVDCAVVISPRKQSLTYKQCGVDGLSV